MIKEINSSEVIKKLVQILKPETSFYIISVVYGIGVSVLTLAIPISVQSLVNTVTFGVVLQPLIVLSIVLLSLLIFSGFLYALQKYIVELFQRHFYARTTADVAVKLVNASFDDITRRNGVELVNRYFDIMTVQKSVSKLLIGGVAVILQTLVGLILLAFYHPYFLVFDIVLIFLIWLTWYLFWKKAIKSAIYESKAKYKVANWLEEMARVNFFFKTWAKKRYALKESDKNINNYLDSRKRHFRKVFIQACLLILIYAIMSALILGLGGYLVIRGQLSLGQLVAAELVVTVILAGFAKFGSYLESFYDLFAALDKISELYDIETIEYQDHHDFSQDGQLDLVLDKAVFRTNHYTFNLDYTFEKGKNYAVHCFYASAKFVFLDLVQKVKQPNNGKLNLGAVTYEQLSVFDIRDKVNLINNPVVIEGSLLDNLTFGLEHVQKSKINEVISLVELDKAVSHFPEGLNTKLLPSGHPLWRSQLIRLEVARAILSGCEIIILSENFDQIERDRKLKILNYIMESDMTVIYFSNDHLDSLHFDKYLSMDREKIVEIDRRDF